MTQIDINIKILNYFDTLIKTPSDINEHFLTLLEYAKKCDHITELGMRYISSTYSFILAKPKTVISIDLYSPYMHNNIFKIEDRYEEIQSFCLSNGINFNFIKGNTLDIDIEETDLLFVDTFHTYKQLTKELELHGNKVKKYIIFHDTTLYGYKDETAGPEQDQICNDNHYIGMKNGTGLNLAITEFLEKNLNWIPEKVFENCNGLTILKRKN